MTHAFGIDLGGTHIKAVAASEDGEILAAASRETRDDEGRWAEAAREIVRELER
ncbi:MAG: ROK family protein, partial [Acidobacteria bacterium]